MLFGALPRQVGGRKDTRESLPRNSSNPSPFWGLSLPIWKHMSNLEVKAQNRDDREKRHNSPKVT